MLAVQDAVRETVEPAGVIVEFNGDAEFPPIEQGTQELLGLLMALIVLLIVFRTFVAMLIPIALALTALATAFLLLFILAGLTTINTITPLLVSMIGLGVGIDYSLFIVTRFRQFLHEGLSPVDAAAEAGASAGRAVLFAGLTVAISVTGLAFFGLDFVTKLGIGSALGVLTTVLIANSLLIAVLRLLGHKVDRLKVPFLRPLDDSDAGREKSLIARWGRFVTAHARGSVRGRAARGPGSGGDVGARSPGRFGPGHAAEGADGPSGLRPARRGLWGRLQRPTPDRRGRERRSAGAAKDLRPRAGARGRGLRARAAVQRREDRRDHLRDAGFCPSGRGYRPARRPLARRRRAGGDRGWRCGRLRLGPDGGVQGHRRTDHGPLAALPVLRHRRDVHPAGDGVQVDRDLADGGDHDDHVGVRRLRSAHARGAGGPPARAHGPRPDWADRDVRAPDRVRDPLRALDGLHGLPHEPHPGGARARPEDARGGRARHLLPSAG